MAFSHMSGRKWLHSDRDPVIMSPMNGRCRKRFVDCSICLFAPGSVSLLVVHSFFPVANMYSALLSMAVVVGLYAYYKKLHGCGGLAKSAKSNPVIIR